MAMEFWEQKQREKGNITGAEMARVLREQYGDVTFDGQTESPVVTQSQKFEEIRKIASQIRGDLEDMGLPAKLCYQIQRYIGYNLPIQSASELSRIHDQDLLALRNIGPGSVRLLRSVLPYQKPTDLTKS